MDDLNNRRILVRQPTPPTFESPTPTPNRVRVVPSSGPAGRDGAAGPPGPAVDELDLPDFTLIFENGLI